MFGITNSKKNDYKLNEEVPQQVSEEDWRTISRFPKYQVHPKYGIRNNKTKKLLKNRMWMGYPRVTLMKDGQKHEVKVHRVVAKEFLINKHPDTHWIVNHKDGDRNNYKASNLEWVTPSGNQMDRWARAKTGWDVKYEAEYPLKKTADEKLSDKDKEKIMMYNAVGQALEGVSGAPVLNNLVGLIKGVKEGHPIVGLLGGTAAVDGANTKNDKKHRFAEAIIGATAGGAVGAALGSMLHGKQASLNKLKYIEKLLKESPDNDTRLNLELASQYYKNRANKSLVPRMVEDSLVGAGVAGSTSAIGYGFGRVFGKKKKDET